jgi:hypothetical protein
MGRAALDIQNGAVTLADGGQIIVDNLSMRTVTSSFRLRGGTLDIRSAVVSNAVPFTVGDGTQSATLSLRRGTNAFWHSCVVQTKATLAGIGSVQGVVTNRGTIAPGRSGAGTLTFTGRLVMTPGSSLDYELGPTNSVGGGVNDLIAVQGDLKLDGQLSISPLTGYTNGVYTLMTYSGTLLGNALGLSSHRPRPHTYRIQIGDGKVLLYVSPMPRGTFTMVF